MPIVVDTSAFLAIFQGEAEAPELMRVLAESDRCLVPASCLVEVALLRRAGENLLPWFEHLIDDESFEVVGITREAGRIAAEAARLYGKGAGHPAQLNFGDCFSFGVAAERGLPLLFAGQDFGRTPIRSALSDTA